MHQSTGTSKEGKSYHEAVVECNLGQAGAMHMSCPLLGSRFLALQCGWRENERLGAGDLDDGMAMPLLLQSARRHGETRLLEQLRVPVTWRREAWCGWFG